MALEEQAAVAASPAPAATAVANETTEETVGSDEARGLARFRALAQEKVEEKRSVNVFCYSC